MADRPDEGFLPPEPAGPEPELGQRPTPEPPAPQQQPPAWQQPPAGQWQQPPTGWAQPPPAWQQPPPPGWGQPQPPWAYPHEPDNGPAVTGFVLAMVSIALWLISAGLSSLVSLGLAIAGLVSSRRGKRKVAAGETPKHKGLAQAGYVSSLVMIVLASLSTLAWTAFFILLAVDEDFRNDLDDGNDNGFGGDGISTSVRVGAVAVRLAATLLS